MYNWLFIILVLFNVCDVIETYIGMKRNWAELNPILNWLFPRIGVLPALALVKAPILGLLYSFHYFEWISPTLNIFVLSFYLVVYVCVITSNFLVLKQIIK
jgi:hypothetical protein